MGTSKILQLAYLNRLDVRDLTFDSNAVRPGSVFFALKGARVDGNRFIPQAVANGAVMVVSAFPTAQNYGVLYVQSDDIDRDMAEAAGKAAALLAETGSAQRSAKSVKAATLASDQRVPPRMTIGRSAASSRLASSSTCRRPGWASTGM